MKKIICLIAIFITLINSTVFANSINYGSPREGINSPTTNKDTFNFKVEVITDSLLASIDDFISTGCINIDYLNQLINLHTEEIKISLTIQEYTDNPEIITLANQIIGEENGELREMRILRDKLREGYCVGTKTDEAYINDYYRITKQMVNDLKAFKPTADDVYDYLNYMLIGNNASIELSNAALNKFTDPITKKIAENIIRLKQDQNTKINSILEVHNKQ